MAAVGSAVVEKEICRRSGDITAGQKHATIGICEIKGSADPVQLEVPTGNIGSSENPRCSICLNGTRDAACSDRLVDIVSDGASTANTDSQEHRDKNKTNVEPGPLRRHFGILHHRCAPQRFC